MALYQGEEMVDVTTPDGRTLTLPRSIVPPSMLPQPQITAAPLGAPPAPLGAPAAPPAEIAPPTLPPPDAPANESVVEMGEPDVTPVVMMEPEVVTANPKRVAGMRKAQAAYAASPQGKQDAVKAQADNADATVASAIFNQADLQAAEDATIADAVADRNKKINELEVARQADMQAQLAQQDQKAGQVGALREKIAKTKIDRELDHPVLAAIAAGLAGLGSAMKGEKVDTLDILYKVIDRKVAAQEADLDRMGQVYGMAKEELTELKERSKSRLEFHNALVAGETQKAIRQIEELTARSASEKTKANAKLMVAQLQQRAADKSMEAVRWGLDYDQKAQAEKNQQSRFYAGLRQADRHHADNMQIDRERIAADLQKALAADRAAGDAATFKARLEASKEVREMGLKGMDNGYLLTPAGRAKVDRAAQLEAEAQKLEEAGKADPMSFNVRNGPQTVEAMRQQAAVLRGDANSFDVVKARNVEQAGALSAKYAAAQSMLDTIDEIKMLYDQEGRGYISRDAVQMEIQSKIGMLNLQLKEVTGSGAWDKGLSLLYKDITGGDPTSGWDVGVVGAIMKQQMVNDPDGFKRRLDSIAGDVTRSTALGIAKNSTWDGKGELFTRKAKGEPNTPEDKAAQALSTPNTPTEAGADVNARSGARRAIDTAHDWLTFGDNSTEAKVRRAEEANASVRYPGLARDQERPFEQLLQGTKAADPATRQRAIDALAARAINAAETRPEYAIPLLHNLREFAPEAYQKARAGLPKGAVDDQMTAEERTQTGAAMTPTPMLAGLVQSSIKPDGTVGDEAGYRELAARAGRKDPIARQAILDIVKRSQHNRALPTGSVFKKGR